MGSPQSQTTRNQAAAAADQGRGRPPPGRCTAARSVGRESSKNIVAHVRRRRHEEQPPDVGALVTSEAAEAGGSAARGLPVRVSKLQQGRRIYRQVTDSRHLGHADPGTEADFEIGTPNITARNFEATLSDVESDEHQLAASMHGRSCRRTKGRKVAKGLLPGAHFPDTGR